MMAAANARSPGYVTLMFCALPVTSLGIAQRCLETMTRYAQERHSFGRPIHEHGQIQTHIGAG